MIIFLLLFWLLFKITIQQDCAHPINYSDFALLLVDSTIVATGGSSDTLEVWTKDISNGLNISDNCWNNINTVSDNNNYTSFQNGIGFKMSNSSFAIQAGDKSSSTMLNLTLFDFTTNTLSTPLINGIVPAPRSRMSVAVNQTTNTAWFYGGRTESTAQLTDYYNSFYNLDINSLTWNWPTTYYSGGQRPARYGHSSNLISERLFIIGGKTAVYSNDSNTWTTSTGDFQSILIYDTNTHQAISMATLGNIPPARYSFTAVNAPDGKSIVLFGGQNVNSVNTFDGTNEVYVLDTCTLNWTQPNIQGNIPVARAGHEAITVNNRYMVIMMGIQNYVDSVGPVYIDDMAILDMETWTWIPTLPKIDTFTSTYKPHCRFNFPIVIPNDGDNNGDVNNGNPTVVSDSSSSSRTKTLAFGITFGILGFLLFATGLVVFILRIRRDVDAKQNPRWLPSVLKKKRQQQENVPLSVPLKY